MKDKIKKFFKEHKNEVICSLGGIGIGAVLSAFCYRRTINEALNLVTESIKLDDDLIKNAKDMYEITERCVDKTIDFTK